MNPKEKRLPVLRPWGGLHYLASVDEVRHLIRSGVAKGFGPAKRLDGCVLHAGPQKWPAGTRYVHNREVSETWRDADGVEHKRRRLEPNARGVYALKDITDLDRGLFRAVQTGCLR